MLAELVVIFIRADAPEKPQLYVKIVSEGLVRSRLARMAFCGFA